MKEHDLIDFLAVAVERGASDLHLTAGAPPMLRVAGVIEPALQAAETARSAARPTADLTAYDLYLRAYAMILAWRALRVDCKNETAAGSDPRAIY